MILIIIKAKSVCHAHIQSWIQMAKSVRHAAPPSEQSKRAAHFEVNCSFGFGLLSKMDAQKLVLVQTIRSAFKV